MLELPDTLEGMPCAAGELCQEERGGREGMGS